MFERMKLARVSPSGGFVAAVAASGAGREGIAVWPFAGSALGAPAAFDLGGVGIADLDFKTDDRLVVTVIQERLRVAGGTYLPPEFARFDRTIVLSIRRDGSDPKVLLEGEARGGTRVQSLLPNDPRRVLIETYDRRTGRNELHKVDVETGEAEPLTATDPGYLTAPVADMYLTGFETDADGSPYVRYLFDARNGESYIDARTPGGAWSTIASFQKIDDVMGVSIAGRAGPSSLYVIDRVGQDRRAVFEVDLSTGASQAVLDDDAGEAVFALRDPRTGEFAGARLVVDGLIRDRYVSKPLAAAHRALIESFPEYAVASIEDASDDLGVYVARLEGPARPPVYVAFDARRMAVADIGPVFALDPGAMSEVRTLRYASADGTPIVAFATVPQGANSASPLLVMPHGGPAAQDTLAFETWRQFFASRGYVVLQPQFRGSDGYGAAFQAKGDGQWGARVQEDVLYGIAEAKRLGLADPARACVFGWSYGGYMALAGAALTPEVYRCAASGAGPSDLRRMIDDLTRRYGSTREGSAFWRRRVGDVPTREAASPALNAGAVRAPVLLLHGDLDRVVPIVQSEIMDEALRAAGRSVEFRRFEGQGHGFDPAQEVEMLRAVESFLATHLNR